MSDIISAVRKLLADRPRSASCVLAIPDLQIPFEHHKALEFCLRLRDKYNPTEVVCLGDEVDQHALGRYAPDPSGMSAGEEQELAQKRLKPWFKEFPDVKVVTSNHSMRVYRKAFEHGIPESMIRGYNELLGAPPTWTLKDHWVIHDVRYEHGDAYGSGSSAFEAAINGNHRSTVYGHHHSQGGVRYFVKPAKKPMFAMNAGCLIDDRKYAFKYAKLSKQRPTLGAGIVIDGIWATFVPLEAVFF